MNSITMKAMWLSGSSRDENSDNAGMSQTTGCLSLVKEPLSVFALLLWILAGERDRFDSDKTVDFGITSLVHHSHSAAANLSYDLVSSETPTPASFIWLRDSQPSRTHVLLV
jgi:hypothetical protein